MELLIAEAQRMYKIRGLRQDACADQKKMEVVAATASTGGDCKCFKCGQTGHVKKDYPKKGKGRNNISNSSSDSNNANNEECQLCVWKGHKIATCWEKLDNLLKQPDRYKRKLFLDEIKKRIADASTGKNEVQAACMDVDDINIEDIKFTCTTTSLSLTETVGASISLNSRSQKLLKHCDIWIGDTSATQHSTFSSLGGINKHECNMKTKGRMGTATNSLVLMDF